MVRPDNKGTTRICLAFMANEWDKAHDGGELSLCIGVSFCHHLYT